MTFKGFFAERRMFREFISMSRRKVTNSAAWEEFFNKPDVTEKLLVSVVRDKNALWEARRLAALKKISLPALRELFEDEYDEVISFSPCLDEALVGGILKRTDDPIVVLRMIMNNMLTVKQRMWVADSLLVTDSDSMRLGETLIHEMIRRETNPDVLNSFTLHPKKLSTDAVYAALLRNRNVSTKKLLEMVTMSTGLERGAMKALLLRNDFTLEEFENVLRETYLLQNTESNLFLKKEVYDFLRKYPEYDGFPDEWLDVQFVP